MRDYSGELEEEKKSWEVREENGGWKPERAKPRKEQGPNYWWCYNNIVFYISLVWFAFFFSCCCLYDTSDQKKTTTSVTALRQSTHY